MSSSYSGTSSAEEATLELAVKHNQSLHPVASPTEQLSCNGASAKLPERFMNVERSKDPGDAQFDAIDDNLHQLSVDRNVLHMSDTSDPIGTACSASNGEVTNPGNVYDRDIPRVSDMPAHPQSHSIWSASVKSSTEKTSGGPSLEAARRAVIQRDRPFVLGSTPNHEIAACAESGGDESQSEIQSIMEQFDDGSQGSSERAEELLAGSRGSLMPNPFTYPPRHSSLDYGQDTYVLSDSDSQSHQASESITDKEMSSAKKPDESGLPSKGTFESELELPRTANEGNREVVTSPSFTISSNSLHKSLPPAPDPEPDLPFDFHRFLEQLRHRTADPVAKFLRSFLTEFGKKQWMVHEQVKIISDFLSFITNKMAQCEIWRGVSDAEFDNAKEGMEKLVMNRLYSQTFSPAIPVANPIAIHRGQGKNAEKPLSFGRRGQHQEDIERDEILAQKVRIYGWVREEHLDIAPVGENGKLFLALAQQELLKIKNYRAPRDKVICVLNCCKVIFGLLRNSKRADTSADSFVPLLIYVVLQANPGHLVSNIQYIMRFRNQEKLSGEAGYYLSSLMGAIQFIENLDRTALTVSDEDFEKHVEAAVSAIAERHKDHPEVYHNIHFPDASGDILTNEKTRPSLEMEQEHRGGSTDIIDETDVVDDNLAVSGLLKTIKRPLSSIGRIFSEELTSPQQPGSSRSAPTLLGPPETPRRLSPGIFQPQRNSSDEAHSEPEREIVRKPRFSAEEAAARQASAEAAEAYRIQRAEHKDVVETLISMFPDLDKDIIDDVVREKQGRVGLAVDACLALST